LDRATYTNSQIQQALSPQTADVIIGLFKPAVLRPLTHTELAYHGPSPPGAPPVGSKAAVHHGALNYASPDATVTEDEIEEYYRANIAAFTLSAEADVTQVDFTDLDAAASFRADLLDGVARADAAAANGGTLSEHGRVLPNTLGTELNTALFSTSAFAALPASDLEVSDVIVISTPIEAGEEGDDEADGEVAVGETDGDAAAEGADAEGSPDSAGGDAAAEDLEGAAAETAAADTAPTEIETYVVLVADRTPARERPLEDV